MYRATLALSALVLVAVAGPMAGSGLTGYSSAAFISGSAASASVTAAADWTPPRVSLRQPASTVAGTVTLTADASDAETGVARVILQDRAPGGSWATICTTTAGSGTAFSCAWDTTRVVDGSHELRAIATDKAGYSATSASVTTTVGNAVTPTITVELSSPGATVRGPVQLTATVRSGAILLPAVSIQVRATGSTDWSTLCTKLTKPYSCAWDTTSRPDGPHELRAVATAVTTTAVSPVVGVRIDNTAPTVALTDPGSPLTGTVSLVAAAGDTGSGVATVRIQTAPAGSTTWTDVCTLRDAPFSCQYDTTQAPDGSRSFRAITTDAAGNSSTSVIVAGRLVDNAAPLKGVDVQATNGGGTAGLLDAGDVLTLTYNRPVALASILPGWDGSPLQVSVRLRDGKLAGLGNFDDTVDVLSSGVPVGLGSVNLGRDQINGNKSLTFTASMAAETVGSGGTDATRITITLVGAADGDGHQRTTGAGTMTWTPSAAATDLLGRASATDPVTESGPLDRYF